MNPAIRYGSSLGTICRAPDLGGGGGGAPPGGGSGAAPGAAAPGSDAPAGGGAADWSASLTDYAPLIETKGWKGKPIGEVLPEVFKSYSTLEKAVGNNVAIPGKDAKPEEWDGLYGKLGRPAEAIGAKGYKLPEAEYSDHDKQFHGAILPILHKAGMTQRQLDAVVPAWNELQVAQRTALDTTATKFHEESTAQLKTAFGGEEQYKAGVDMATRAFRTVFGGAADELMSARLADGRYLRHIPGLVQGMAKLGAQLQESGGLEGEAPENFHDAGGTAQAKAELDKIYQEAGRDAKHPYADPKHPEHQAMQDKVFRLTKQVAGAG